MVKQISDYDVIFVGAGPAGSWGGLTAASRGLKTLIIERGRSPGKKNVSGFGFPGMLIKRTLDSAGIDVDVSEAPIERLTNGMLFYFFDGEEATELYTKDHVYKSPWGIFMAYRDRLDAWVAQKAVERGAELKTSTCVVDVIKNEGGTVEGVITDEGEKIKAQVTVGADGVNSVVATKSGLREKWSPSVVTTAVKMDVYLGREVVDERFADSDGSVPIMQFYDIRDLWHEGLGTNAWTYAMGDSVSVATFCMISDMRFNPYEYLRNFMEYPHVKKLLRGGKPRSYMAHLIPMGQFSKIRTFGDGVLITGDAAGCPNPVHGGGYGEATITGIYAALTAVKAIEKGDTSSETLRNYNDMALKNPIIEYKDHWEYADWLYNDFKMENLHKILQSLTTMVYMPLYWQTLLSEIYTPILPKLKKAIKWLNGPYRKIVTETINRIGKEGES